MKVSAVIATLLALQLSQGDIDLYFSSDNGKVLLDFGKNRKLYINQGDKEYKHYAIFAIGTLSKDEKLESIKK